MSVRSAIRSRLLKSFAGLRGRPIPATTTTLSPAPNRQTHRLETEATERTTRADTQPNRGICNNRRRHPRRLCSAFAYFARHQIDNTLQQIGSDSNVLTIHVDTVSLPCHQHHQPLISAA